MIKHWHRAFYLFPVYLVPWSVALHRLDEGYFFKTMSRFSKSQREPKRITPETGLKRAVKQYLTLKGWKVWHNYQSLGSFAGIADLTAVKKGVDSLPRTLWIEVKSKNGKQSPRQSDFQQIIETAGGEYLIVKSIDDLEDYEI